MECLIPSFLLINKHTVVIIALVKKYTKKLKDKRTKSVGTKEQLCETRPYGAYIVPADITVQKMMFLAQRIATFL